MRYIFAHKNLLLLFVSTFFFFISEALLMPTLPLYLTQLDYSNSRIGVVLGAFALGVLALRPPAGTLTDRRSRKLGLVIGVAIFFVAPLLYLFSSAFGYLLFVRFFHGIGITFFTTASPTIVADLAPENRRGEIIGHMGIASAASFVLGPMLGVFLYDALGITAVLVTCSLLGFFCLLFALFITETRGDSRRRTGGGYGRVLGNRSVVVSSILILVTALMTGGVYTFLPVLVQAAFELNVGVLFMVTALTMILFRFFTSQLSDRYGRGPAIFYPLLGITVSLVLIGGAGTSSVLFAAAILNGIGSAMCLPALTSLVVDRTEPGLRGTAFSIFYGAYDVGMILAGVVFGFFADWFGLRQSFVIAAGLGLAAALFFALSIQPKTVHSIVWTTRGERPH